ncbi:ABC transporter permease [Paenibacillus sp. GP183]|jgi:ABC-2 type transport system permease protein|uniref:ABC transporter permease n=1 Tax=Paenibacillus sp. GP183 TaxID=1882751 RepID=UPI00089CF0A3|nr:ABC transporter permease [Paenibacillus sp. GP183]SEC43189.1 ABC-2 type transport system permease protein [Paenibacillus sp. GP183]
MNAPLNPLGLQPPRIKGGPRRWWTEASILFRIQFAIVKDSWAWVLLMATLFPLSTILFMRFYTVNPSDEMIVQIIAGNLIFGVIVMGMNGIGQEISWQKHQDHFTFYASLPISKNNFVLANMLRGLMNTLPSLFILGVLGQWIYGVRLHYSPGLPIVILLCLFSVVGIGVILGFWSPNHQLTNMLCQALMMFVSFLSPIMVEMNQLPVPLQWISYAFPTTYAADAMRKVLTVGWTEDVMLDCAVMLVFSLISLFIVNRIVSWRLDK